MRRYILPCTQKWTSRLGCAQRHWMHSGVAKQEAWFSSLYTSRTSPDVIPQLSSCFTSWRGQDTGAATLHHWDHAVVVLTVLHRTFVSQCPPLERRPKLPPWFLQGSTSSSWPYLELERRWWGGRACTQPRGDQRSALCMTRLALVPLHHRTARWHWSGVFRWGLQHALRFLCE